MKIYWTGTSKNIVGEKVRELRHAQKLTQKGLAEKLQLIGFEFSDLTILRIVSDCDRGGRRSVPVNLAVPSGTQRPCIFFLWIPCIVHSISPRRRVSLARRSPPTRRRGSADRSHQFPNIKSPY